MPPLKRYRADFFPLSWARRSIVCANPSDLTLSQLAEKSGVAKSIISQIERNETNPTLGTSLRLSQALDTSIEEVLRSEERPALIEKVNEAQWCLADLRRPQDQAADHGLSNVVIGCKFMNSKSLAMS